MPNPNRSGGVRASITYGKEKNQNLMQTPQTLRLGSYSQVKETEDKTDTNPKETNNQEEEQQ